MALLIILIGEARSCNRAIALPCPLQTDHKSQLEATSRSSAPEAGCQGCEITERSVTMFVSLQWSRQKKPSNCGGPKCVPLQIEPLESRWLPSSFHPLLLRIPQLASETTDSGFPGSSLM